MNKILLGFMNEHLSDFGSIEAKDRELSLYVQFLDLVQNSLCI